MTVLRLDDHRPHLTIMTVDGNAHVLPVSLVRDWIEGRRPIVETDDWEIIVRTICKEWLDGLKQDL